MACRDRGSATVEFVLVAPLVVLVAVAVLQLTLALHVRSTLTAAAGEGARVAALVGVDPQLGAERATAVLQGNLAAATVTDVRVTHDVIDGLPMAVVEIDARLPLVGLLGPAVMHVIGHAMEESA